MDRSLHSSPRACCAGAHSPVFALHLAILWELRQGLWGLRSRSRSCRPQAKTGIPPCLTSHFSILQLLSLSWRGSWCAVCGGTQGWVIYRSLHLCFLLLVPYLLEFRMLLILRCTTTLYLTKKKHHTTN